jgi:AAA domain (dynein-related subfamily)
MNIQDFKDSLPYLVKAEVTPFIWGHAGIGKTEVVRQYAKDNGFHFFPFYLGAMSDVGDILGLADFIKDTSGNTIATRFAPPEWLVKAIDYCNANPDSGAIIFLDEFNRARRDILNGMFSLALDKTFHTIKLPKNCHIIAAGNPPTDEYFTTDVNETALMARFVHIKLEPTFEEWLKYAENKKIDNSLVGFLKNQPELLEQKHTDFQLPVKVDRRAFERLDRLFKLEVPQHLLQQLMHGIIGIERTVAYLTYLQKVDKPLKGAQILNPDNLFTIEKWSNPENVLSSLLNLTMDNLKEYMLELEKSQSTLTLDEKKSLMAVLSTTPKDISFPFISNMVQSNNVLFREFSTDPAYEEEVVNLCLSAKGKDKVA